MNVLHPEFLCYCLRIRLRLDPTPSTTTLLFLGFLTYCALLSRSTLCPWVLPVSFQRLLTIHLTSFDLFNPPYAIHAYLSLLFGQSTIIHNNYPCHDPFFLCSLFIVSRYITAQPYTLTHKGRFINTIASYTPLISKYPSPSSVSSPCSSIRFVVLCVIALLGCESRSLSTLTLLCLPAGVFFFCGTVRFDMTCVSVCCIA